MRIAAWARAEGAAEERERIRERLAGLERYELTSGGLLGSSVTISAAADWMNYRHVLAALDRDGSDTREGEQ